MSDNETTKVVDGWPIDVAGAGANPVNRRVMLITIGVVVAVGALVTILAIAGVFNEQGTVHISNPNAVGACIADAKTIETSISAYDAQFTPAIGKEVVGTAAGDITYGQPSTYGSGDQAAKLIARQYISYWPTNSAGYAVSVSSSIAGDVSIYVPANSTHPIDFETETRSTGCNAL